MNNKSFKNYIIILVLILLFSVAYFFIKKFNSKEGLEYEQYLKNYEANEYISTYVSDEQMAKIYLNDYIYNLHYNVEKAYNSLDKLYRDAKFGNIEAYKNYIMTSLYNEYNVTKYYVKTKNKYTLYGVYDNNGNIYIFKTKGVMQYTLFLDDYTIEI